MKKLTIISSLFIIYFFVDYNPAYSQNFTTSTTDVGSTTDISININVNTGTTDSGSTGSTGTNGGTSNPTNTTYSGSCICHDSLGGTIGVGHYDHNIGYGYGHYICHCPCHQ